MDLVTPIIQAIGAAAAIGAAVFGAHVGSIDHNPALPGVYVTPDARFDVPAPVERPLFEDEEGWNCAEHGNKICGENADPSVLPSNYENEFPDTTVCYLKNTGTDWIWASDFTLDGTCFGTRYGS